MRKVADYVRVSSEEQSREGISLDAQRARIVAYCAMRGLDLVELVEDPGVSAAKPLNARPGGRVANANGFPAAKGLGASSQC
jgi:DNA invertase Pin-like site-specific DNA recombinase